MRRLIGLIFLAAGIAIILFAHYEKGKISQAAKKANERIEAGQGVFQENPVGQAVGTVVGEAAHQAVAIKVAHYQQIVMWLTIIGGIIVAVGLLMIIFNGRKRRRRR